MFCEHEAYEKAKKIKELRRKKILLAHKRKFKRWLDYYTIGDVEVENSFKGVLSGANKRN